MREQPGAAELIDAVAHFLRQVAGPKLDTRTAFHARVAANALDIVRREFLTGGQAAEAETERLEKLLGHTGENELLNRELCGRIAGGDIETDDPALLDHLWRTTLDVVAIDQPKYATYRRVLACMAAEG